MLVEVARFWPWGESGISEGLSGQELASVDPRCCFFLPLNDGLHLMLVEDFSMGDGCSQQLP